MFFCGKNWGLIFWSAAEYSSALSHNPEREQAPLEKAIVFEHPHVKGQGIPMSLKRPGFNSHWWESSAGSKRMTCWHSNPTETRDSHFFNLDCACTQRNLIKSLLVSVFVLSRLLLSLFLWIRLAKSHEHFLKYHKSFWRAITILFTSIKLVSLLVIARVRVIDVASKHTVRLALADVRPVVIQTARLASTRTRRCGLQYNTHTFTYKFGEEKNTI